MHGTRPRLTNKIFLLFSGVAVLIYAITLMFVTSIDTGVWICSGLGLLLILYAIFSDHPHLLRLKPVFKVLFRVGAILIITVGMFILYMFFSGQNDTVTYDEDVLIVLGAGIRGEHVTTVLADRLRVSIKYHERNPKALIIVSGSQGPQESITEALAMERYLLRAGIPQDRIIKEEDSHSTYDNFTFSKRIIDRLVSEKILPEDYKACFITNDFHILRANTYATNLGLITTHLHAPTRLYLVPVAYIRECLAMVKMVLVLM